MLDKLERVTYLYDIYSNLLTEKQQKALQMYYFDNFSLGEIALEYNISRQGVYDLLRRALQSLEGLEANMQLYTSYLYRKEKLQDAWDILSQPSLGDDDMQRLQGLMKELIEENEA